ncbi:MAG: bifunctional phosphoglucose/phosphomannose isomerase [Candidatus Woesearchaeota archaeon]
MSKESARDQIVAFPEQFYKVKVPKIKAELSSVKGIVIVGMGGSALSGEILKNYLEYKKIKIPVHIIREYHIPEYVDKHYLIFVQSYSGSTEETISCLRDCYSKKLNTIVISSGGYIKELADKYNFPFVELPKGYQPRLALGYFLFAELSLLEELLSLNLDAELELLKMVNWKNHEEYGRQLAEKINATPIIYASYSLSSVAMIWKALINECSKQACFFNFFSELNHNEMVGFTLSKDYYVIILQDVEDHYRIKKRMELFQDIMKKMEIKTVIISFKGSSYLSRVLSLIHIGMWVSYYLAIKNEVDPEKVEIIEDFKRKLGKFI